MHVKGDTTFTLHVNLEELKILIDSLAESVAVRPSVLATRMKKGQKMHDKLCQIHDDFT